MDIFVEQIIKRKFGLADYAVVVASLLGSVVLVLLAVLFVPYLSAFVLIGVCVGAYYAITSRSVEYEYSITNGDITVDKIIFRRKRKRILSVDAHEVDAMGKYNPEQHRGKTYAGRYICSVNGSGEGSWYFSAHHPKKGYVLIVFDPEEKVLNAIRPFLPRQVMQSAFGGK